MYLHSYELTSSLGTPHRILTRQFGLLHCQCKQIVFLKRKRLLLNTFQENFSQFLRKFLHKVKLSVTIHFGENFLVQQQHDKHASVLLATYDFGLEVACPETSQFVNYKIRISQIQMLNRSKI